MSAFAQAPRWLGFTGAALVVAGLAWWAVVFSVVLNAGVLSRLEALKCVAVSSGLCSLATAICGDVHPFGIKTYSPNLVWVGIAVLAGAALLQARRA